MSETRDPELRALVRELVGAAPAPPTVRFEGRPRRRPARAALAALTAAVVVGASVAWVATRDRGTNGRNARVTITTQHVVPAFADLLRPVALAGGPSVRVVSPSGVTTIAGRATCCVQWSPDGRWVGFLSSADPQNGGALVIARADGTHRQVLAENVRAFAWGQGKIAINATSGVTIRAIEGRFAGQVVRLTPRSANGVLWAPDGSRLALAAPVGGYVDELRIATVGSAPTCATLTECVTTGPPLDVGPHDPHFQLRIASWRPDGRALVIWMETLEDNGRLDGVPLVLVSLDGPAPRTLGSGVVQPDWVQWSPDGSRLAFIEGVGRFQLDEARQLAVCDSRGTCRTLTAKSVLARDPSWSADGLSIFYTAISAAESVRLATQSPGHWQLPFAHRQLRSIAVDGRGDHAIALVAPGVGGLQLLDGDHLLLVHARTVEQVDLRTGAIVVVGHLVENPSTDPYYKEPHSMPDDHPYEGIESGPGGWRQWFVAAAAG